MKKNKMTASSLHAIMITVLFITVGLSTGGFYFAQDYLGKLARDTSNTTTKSTNSNMSSQQIAQLQSQLTSKQSVIDKANNITVPDQDYKSQVVGDLTKYATNNGMSITDSSTSSTAPADSNSATVGGAKLSYITITLGNPIPIASLVKFLKSVESNIPKLQPTGLTIKSNASPIGTVNVDPITIEVYVNEK